MTRRITVLLTVTIAIGIALGALADSINLKKTGSTYVYTVPHKGPVELGSVAFTLPANITNTFTVSVVRDIVERQTVGSVITTNLYNRIETNTNWQVTNEVHTLLTNLLCSVDSTNVVKTQVIDKKVHLPDAFHITEGDKIIYSWSDTNTFWFLQTIESE